MKKAETKDRIKEALELREMKQSELAEKTGIDKGQMSSYLAGRYNPKQNNLRLIADALSVDEAWLMGFDVPMERNASNYNITDVSQDLKNLIIEKYGSLSKFAEKIGMPWTTLDSVLRKGVNNSNISNINKICQELQISTDELSKGNIISAKEYINFNFPQDIRAAARNMMDLSPEDKKTAIDMINYLTQKGKEAKKN